MDEWRTVPRCEGKYQISISSKEGKCRSCYNGRWGVRTWHELSNNICKLGRIIWSLAENGKRKTKQAAYWIALTYPELVQNEYFEGAEIDHIDGDVLNNHPSNLRWVTHKDNMNNPVTRQRHSSSLKGRKLSEETKNKFKARKTKETKTVYQYNLEGELENVWKQASEAANALIILEGQIRKCCLGYLKTYKGYVWRYEKK